MDCTECGKPAVTKDGRSLCLKCLRASIRDAVPMTGCYRGMYRTPDHKQATSAEGNAIDDGARAIEDARESA